MLGKTEPTTTPTRRTFLNIKNGAIVKRNESGAEESFSYVEGKVSSLFTKERTFRNEKVIYWYLDLRDDEGETYSLASSYSSNVFKSIILSLSSEKGLDAIRNGRNIKIEAYQKGGYDKVFVTSDGDRLEWATATLPPLQEVTIGGKTMKDDSARMEFISNLAYKIKSNIVIK